MSGGKRRSGFQITSVRSDYAEVLSSQSAGTVQGSSSSQPNTPSPHRKLTSHDAAGQGAGPSRFRVVRLAAGRPEPYHRGRWTCTDFPEREEAAGLRRVMDSMRHAHSLESLEMIGRVRGAGHQAHSQDPAHPLPQPAQGEGFGGARPLLPRSDPPSPRRRRPVDARLLDPDEPIGSLYSDVTPPPLSPSALRLDVGTVDPSVLKLALSQPRSPDVPFQFSRTPSTFSLDQTIFDLQGETSASSNSLISIDNKIQQAMELVKTHLMQAVREELELLKDQIRQLQARNSQLERENYILRSLLPQH